ncbi:hypothetical protein N781_07755 [Pontibacillus halophilus JSM 076056 = DSM 19796]|uniref:BRCT domain-containing protein n=1 Tax=Pontibacillus halophilus JSM 076056 = DSM 19796 TaxID=1385510 RepID=A0A0A5GEA2_9BACI|nr:hypothetical protein [Pontibacillus halophilus]KGX90349.1 hypothetical protein N781_07755 [Pontibacillus halophilus JSM 076056 = DSM 19796]
MLGFMLNDYERREMAYMLKREMEEVLLDLDDQRIDHIVKGAMEKRYRILFRMYKRVADERECLKYVPPKWKYQ